MREQNVGACGKQVKELNGVEGDEGLGTSLALLVGRRTQYPGEALRANKGHVLFVGLLADVL